MIVKYRRLYPYAPYLNEEIGYEKSIPDDSTDEQMIGAVLHLKSVADKAHEKANPGISVNQTPEPYHHEPPVIDRGAERVEILIENAESLSELEAYKPNAEKFGLSEKWIAKYVSFQKGNSKTEKQ